MSEIQMLETIVFTGVLTEGTLLTLLAIKVVEFVRRKR